MHHQQRHVSSFSPSQTGAMQQRKSSPAISEQRRGTGFRHACPRAARAARWLMADGCCGYGFVAAMPEPLSTLSRASSVPRVMAK